MKPNRKSFAEEMAEAIMADEDMQTMVIYDLVTGEFGSRASASPLQAGEIDIVAAWDNGYDTDTDEDWEDYFLNHANDDWAQALETINQAYREQVVELYEDSGGGLFLQVDKRNCYWGDLEYTNSNFAEDASCLTNTPSDTMAWTIPVFGGQLSHDPPNIEHVATYQDGQITWISDSLGRAAEQYLGRSPLSVAEAAALRGVAKITVNKWISDQGLPARKIGNQYVVRLADLMAFEPAPAGWPTR